MKKHNEIILVMLIFLAFASCNWGIPDYQVAVTVEEGVTGAPETGEYSHTEGTVINYEYLPEDPLHTVEVFINASRTVGSGSITVWTSFSLTARIVDIRRTWKMQMRWSASSEVNFEFNITFSGADLTSGTFSDDRGFHGLWTAEDGAITITFTDWNDFVLVGSVFAMTGTFTGDGSEGAWIAEEPE
ncbi:hypothetical protein ACFLT2_12100 [Acidobacteriota bacterium]